MAMTANRNDWSLGGSPHDPTASQSARARWSVVSRMRRRATPAAYIADHAIVMRRSTATTDTMLTPNGVSKTAMSTDSAPANKDDTSAPPTRKAGTPAPPPEK